MQLHKDKWLNSAETGAATCPGRKDIGGCFALPVPTPVWDHFSACWWDKKVYLPCFFKMTLQVEIKLGQMAARMNNLELEEEEGAAMEAMKLTYVTEMESRRSFEAGQCGRMWEWLFELELVCWRVSSHITTVQSSASVLLPELLQVAWELFRARKCWPAARNLI